MLLNQSKEILDRRISEVGKFTKQLALNPEFMLQLNRQNPDVKKRVFELWRTAQDIATFSKTNDFLEDYYIYLENYEAILTPNSIFYRKDHFYQTSHYKNISLIDWEATILNGNHNSKIIPSESYIQNNKEKSMISYLQSLPLNNYNHSKGTVVVLINVENIENLLQSISKQYNGWAYVTDNNGKHIASVGVSEEQIDTLESQLDPNKTSKTQELKGDTLFIRTFSNSNGWIYTAGIPKQEIMKEAEKIKQVTLYITATTLIIGVLIGLFFASRNSRPIKNLVETLKEQVGETAQIKNKNEFDFLQGNINKLLSNNKGMQFEIQKQNLLLKEAYLKQLINGEMYSEKDLITGIKQLKITGLTRFGYMAMIKMTDYIDLDDKKDYNNLNADRLIVKEYLSNIEIISTDIDKDSMVIFITYEKEDSQVNNKQTDKILNEFLTSMKHYGISITISVGSVFNSYLDISKSYHEARQTMDFALLVGSSGINWYDKLKETDVLYYPIDSELRLINAMKAGEMSEAKRILTQLLKENFTNRKLFIEMIDVLIDEIRGSLLKVFEPTIFNDASEFEYWKNKVLHIQFNGEFDEVENKFNKVIETYCQLIEDKKKLVGNETVDAIIAFLHDSYDNPDLSLYLISKQVGHSEKYVSQLFKEITGVYLFDYLEDIRINKAKELLSQTNETIEALSKKVGYNSPQSFRRAFKRVANVTPNQYRKIG